MTVSGCATIEVPATSAIRIGRMMIGLELFFVEMIDVIQPEKKAAGLEKIAVTIRSTVAGGLVGSIPAMEKYNTA